MAYTRECMEFDAGTGHGAWYLVDPSNSDDRAPFLAPYDHVSRVLFHSAFDYFEKVYDTTVSVTFPQRIDPLGPSIPQSYTHTPITTLPADLFCWVLFWQGVEMKDIVIQTKGGAPIRKIIPSRSGTSVVITEVVDSTLLSTNDRPFTYPAVTGSLRAVAVKPAAAQQSTLPFDINSAAFQMGFGKLDFITRSYLRATAAGVGTHKLTQGRSIDATAAGVKFWNADGTTRTFGTYSGSHPGPSIMTIR